MVRDILAAAILAGAPTLAHAQSASAPLVVTATVVSTCKVDVPQSAEAATFATMTVTVICARRGTTPRVQRPVAPRRSEVRDAVLIIDF
jgi:branched-subunit amino acid ABC-type transport system permease component